MARARNNPAAAPDADEASEPSGKTVKLTYNGPSGQSVIGLGAELEPGESYDVPEEIADGLLAGSAFWEK